MATPNLTVKVAQCSATFPGDPCQAARERTAAEYCSWVSAPSISVAYGAGKCGDLANPPLCEGTGQTGCTWSGSWNMGYYTCGSGYNPCTGGADCDPVEANIGTPYNTTACNDVGYTCGRFIDAVVDIEYLDSPSQCVYRVFPRVSITPSINICGCGGQTCFWDSSPMTAYATDGTYDVGRDSYYREFSALSCQGFAELLLQNVKGSYGQHQDFTGPWSWSIDVI